MALGGLARFAGLELGLWAGLYGAYRTTHNLAIGSEIPPLSRPALGAA